MLLQRFSKTKVIPLEDCTGCSLCSNVCPQKCITMKEGKLGHLFPYVDNKNCIQCNLCVKTCPSNKDISLTYPLTAYAAWAKEKKEYVSSSSGGAASVLSHEIILRGGVVYGCSMSSECEVRHIRVEKAEELYKLKGSKYVQSIIKDILPILKEDIKQGRQVLFIGTPCQVAAVKGLFKEIPDTLFLVDLVCHGVPSLKTLQEYLKTEFGTCVFDSISFRNGTKLSLVLNNKGVKMYEGSSRTDLYYKTFMEGYTYRDSCHHCKYAQPNRISDITIGDFWGLGRMGDCDIPEHNEGISVMLPLTEKGIALIQAVNDKFNIYDRPVEEAIKGNSQLMSPSLAGKRIRLFQRLEPLFGLKRAYRLSHLDIVMKNYLK